MYHYFGPRIQSLFVSIKLGHYCQGAIVSFPPRYMLNHANHRTSFHRTPRRSRTSRYMHIISNKLQLLFRFTQKFAAIVQRERGQNFITRLHKGHLDIIPWPVIESSQFYGLFEVLKERLIKRPTTHRHAVQFVDTLKTLMAKLKVRVQTYP